jgi:hypothetical protein
MLWWPMSVERGFLPRGGLVQDFIRRLKMDRKDQARAISLSSDQGVFVAYIVTEP